MIKNRFAANPHARDEDLTTALEVTGQKRPGMANGNIEFGDRITCTVPEACKVTSLGRTKLYELIGSGELDTITIGRRRLVVVRSLLTLFGSKHA